ncbi:MAG: exopolysaccharide biosynthesis polyprenyl glycosylphosphotransferase [Streptosporangiaceae bacterium]|jgi:exopolysaccharide biosynthesis polyprenyl glycosylphosphotransferase
MSSSVRRGEPAWPSRPAGQPACPDGSPVKAAAAPAPAAAGGLRSPVRQAAAGLAAVLPAADAAALAAALLAASITAGLPAWPAAAYSVAVLLALSVSGLQRLRICARVSDQAGRTLAAVTGPAVILLPWMQATAALRLVAWSAGLVLAVRVAAMTALRAARRRGRLTEPALLVGAGPAGEQVLGLLLEHPELGLRPRGFIGSSRAAEPGEPASEPGLPVLGSPADLPGVVAQHGIRRVIVCCPVDGDDELASALGELGGPGVRRAPRVDACVTAWPGGLGTAVPRACLDEIWGIPLIPLRPGRLAGRMVAKRAFDVAGAAILLAAAAPLLAVLALVIKVRRRHPVLFRQARVVGRGRLAEIIKLRTMGSHPDADTCWVVPTRHLTPLGNWLRGTHLDELPQLVNVLRGDMSLVGPRPERPYFAEKFGREIPRYDDRHRMRAGITGLAQVRGLHGDTSIHERVRFDNLYIDNWSLWLDIVILASTVTGAVRRRKTGGAAVTRAGQPAVAGVRKGGQ